MAYNHKNDLKMPSGEVWIEKTNANLVNKDEQAAAEKILKDANSTIVNDIKSINFTIDGVNHAYYEITYTDGSISKKIEATNLKIIQVTETSATPTIEKVQVIDKQIVVTLDKEVTKGTKFYFVKNFTDGEEKNFCQDGSCTTDKSNSEEMSQAISINGKKVIFPINDDNDLVLGKEFGIVIKEPHKFRSCAKSEPVLATPDKIAVKDPKKLKSKEKEDIADAIRKANTTSNGVSKLPNGIGYYEGIPAFIEISDDGKVKIIDPINVEGTWDDSGKFIPTINKDGTVNVITGNENNVIHFDKPEELLSNLAPDAPTVENKDGNVVVTPAAADTDAKKVIIEFKGKNGYSKTIVAEKTDTG